MSRSKKDAKKAAAKWSKEFSAGVRGNERDFHFENGGTLSGWLGTSGIHKSRRDKRRTRGSDRVKSIKDGGNE